MEGYYQLLSLSIMVGGLCGVFGILIGLGINNRKIAAYQKMAEKHEELVKLKNAYIYKLKRRIATLAEQRKYMAEQKNDM